MTDRWYPGPFSHPYPGVSNCRTDKGLAGEPPAPGDRAARLQGRRRRPAGGARRELGLPAPPDAPVPADRPRVEHRRLRGGGHPGARELLGAGVHRARGGHRRPPAGDAASATSSSPSAPASSGRTKRSTSRRAPTASRATSTSATTGGRSAGRTATAPTSRTAAAAAPGPARIPAHPGTTLPPVSDHALQADAGAGQQPGERLERRRQRRQRPSRSRSDPTQIRGNYTHDDGADSAALGYALTVPIAMANDYNGYIASYREYQRGDHYRKALTGWGPHSSDYMATRLVDMGRPARDPAARAARTTSGQEKPWSPRRSLDTAVNDAARRSARRDRRAPRSHAYEAALPDDGGRAGGHPAARGRRALRRVLLQLGRRLQLHRQPARQGAAPQGRELVGLRRPVRRDPGDVRVPAGRGRAELPAGRPGVALDRALRGVRGSVRDTSEGRARRRRAPTASSIDGMRRQGGAAVPYHLTSDRSRCARGSGSRWRTCGWTRVER